MLKRHKPLKGRKAGCSSKPKRGTKFLHNGNLVHLYITDGDIYVVSDDPKFAKVKRVPAKNLKPYVAVRAPIKKHKKVLSAEQLKAKEELRLFFIEMWSVAPMYCENCDADMEAYTQAQVKFVTAHILPKREEHGFPQLATNPHNIFFLGVRCGCHKKWDDTDSSVRKTMRVYDAAVNVYNQHLKAELPESDHPRAEKYLGI